MIRCALVGASGYTGAQLAELLLSHPHAEIVGMFGSARPDAPRTFSDIHPRFRTECDLPIEPTNPDIIRDRAPDAVFLCTPHEVSAELTGRLRAAGVTAAILDLSAAFRLPDPSLYESFYSFTHPHPDLLDAAVYGLVERARQPLATADLIAVPGCYPTSVILPTAPLIDTGALDPSARLIADCISGVSGAGRSPNDRNMFCEVSVQPYGVWKHRHAPEIAAHAGRPVVFTPHLGPYDRGIVSTIHADLTPGVSESRVRGILADAYRDAPFIRLLPAGSWPSVNAVRHTNYCDIALAISDNHLILVSAIDNLVKGASGQAVQCLNARFGLEETAGLRAPALAGVTA